MKNILQKEWENVCEKVEQVRGEAAKVALAAECFIGDVIASAAQVFHHLNDTTAFVDARLLPFIQHPQYESIKKRVMDDGYAQAIVSAYAIKVLHPEVKVNDVINIVDQLLAQQAQVFGVFNTGKGRLPMKDRILVGSWMESNPRLKRIAVIIGRMQKIMARARAKVRNERDDFGITQGNNIPLALSSEKVALAAMPGKFAKKYTERALVQREPFGYDDRGKGPIIVALDESGSMGDFVDKKNPFLGTCDMWSKSVVIVLMGIAREEKRDLIVLHFNDRIIQMDEYRGGKGTPEKIFETVNVHPSNGTRFQAWMDASLKLLKSSKANWSMADVVCITDAGFDFINQRDKEEWQKSKKDLSFRSFAIFVGVKNPEIVDIFDDFTVITDASGETDALLKLAVL